MTTPVLVHRSAAELMALMESGEVTAVQVTQAHLDRISAVDGDGSGDTDVHAFLVVTGEAALAQAAEVDRKRAAGEPLGALAGVPIAVKDLVVTRGVVTTSGSKILQGWVPPYDATIVHRMRDADAIMLGKTNMDEFAMGSSNENSAYGDVRNPWDLGRVPGGSSGGSAASVAAHMAPLAVGTDTGGSIRQPAALCGLVGGKPTYGAVSRYGLIAFASSLDQAGPLARTVEDAARFQMVLSGHDPLDSTSIPQPPRDLLTELKDGVKGMKLGVVTELQGEGYEPGVEEAFAKALEVYRELGAEIVEISLPHSPYGLPAYYLVAPSECSSNLSRFDGVRFGNRVDAETTELMMAATRANGFGAEVKRRIMIGTHALSSGYYDAYYAQASKVRTLIADDFKAAFTQVDALISPTSPSVAFGHGTKTADPIAMYLNDVATVPASLAGVPAVSIPCGLASPPEGGDPLPVGLQIVAPLNRDEVMYRVAWAFEQAVKFDTIPRGANAIAPAQA
ncbi:MAG: aspartyl-tRNA(Asn)/glutamyl-tRNA(Gln) amidotransferase subunit A [Glaciecola sp.]|jgi:aspartyl-tRNA(Asn)/glutamyl-tRNA(Gln) amidotransferase subunit A